MAVRQLIAARPTDLAIVGSSTGCRVGVFRLPSTPPVGISGETRVVNSLTLRTTAAAAGRIAAKGLVGLVAFLVIGNLVILAASFWARGATDAQAIDIPGVANAERVDSRLLRGAAPTAEGYQALKAMGVTTIVDLRAEEGVESDVATVTQLGMEAVRIPIRDGQTPTSEEVQQFLAVFASDPDGLVFVHCGAGVGRTGAMVGTYLVATGKADGADAVRRNLAVGPPTLEQLAFVANLSADDLGRPGLAVRAASRVLDAPRRIAHNLGF